MWAIKDNDLGGLTQPLTFVKDQTAEMKICFWNIKIEHGSRVSPAGGHRHCVE